MKIVYVAGPFRAPTAWRIEQNIRRAEELGLEVARLGAMPVIPHTNTRFFQGEGPDDGADQFWLDGTLELLRRSDAVILVAGWESSSGTCAEVAEARRIGIPVFGRKKQLDPDLDGLSKWLNEQAAIRTRDTLPEIECDRTNSCGNFGCGCD